MHQLLFVACCLISIHAGVAFSKIKTHENSSNISIVESYLDKLNTELLKDASLHYALPFPSLDSLLPPLWDEVLPLDSEHFHQDSERRFEVDAWDYLQRMTLYKYLIDNLQHCAWADLSKKSHEKVYNLGSILWGLPLQHGWQFSSGRLLTAPNSTVLTSSAWWADMNYYLSIIPYLGAVEAGVAPSIVLTTNPDPSRFCTSASACPDIVQPWKDFFVLLNATANDCSSNSISKTPLSGTPIADQADFNLTYPP